LKLIVGLGNPGPRYAKNRHNVGYRCVDLLVQRLQVPAPLGMGLGSGRVMFKANVVGARMGETKVVLARPLAFMNLSGQSVGPLLHWYHAELSDLLVIYDDLDLPLGRVRLRPNGGAGGHKGMLSIIETLGTRGFARLRVGIGRPAHGDPQDYVLNDFTLDESIVMQGAYERAAQATEAFVIEGIETAMNQFNPPDDSRGTLNGLAEESES
jgi:PTH1 family peptidyl-tRNA hydrolase